MVASSLTKQKPQRIGGYTQIELSWTADSGDGSFITAEIGAGFKHLLHRIIVEPGSRVIANDNNNFIWTDSPAQAGEFYMTTPSGGDPGISKPDDVLTDNTVRTEAAVGSLAANQWDYGNNDTLGFNTIYFLGDPSAQALGWIVFQEAGTAPTDNYDVELLDGNFVRLDGGVLGNLDEAVASFVEPKDSAGTIIPGRLMIYDRLLLEITNNSVSSAQGTFKLILEDIPEGRTGR